MNKEQVLLNVDEFQTFSSYNEVRMILRALCLSIINFHFACTGVFDFILVVLLKLAKASSWYVVGVGSQRVEWNDLSLSHPTRRTSKLRAWTLAYES